MNRVLLTGRLTRDPELRTTAGGKAVATVLRRHPRVRRRKEKPEFHSVVAWDRLAETCGKYLGKGQQVAVEGRIQTRTWDDDQGKRHWKTEIVAASVEMLSGRAAQGLPRRDGRAGARGAGGRGRRSSPTPTEPIADDAASASPRATDEDDEEDELLEEAVAA